MTPLKATSLDHSHYVRLHMTAAVPPGTSLEDVLTPGYWANHAYRMKPGSIIEVLSEDNVLDCDLRVLETGPTFARVRLIRHFVEAPASKKSAPKEATEEVIVDYGGKNDRWRFIHRGEVVKAGFATEAEAAEAADKYRSKLAA